MTRNIDELSNLTTQKAEPPKEYFGKMDLNEEQVEKRLQYTKKANELFDVILVLLLTMNERGETNFFYAKSLLESWILSLVAEFTTPDDYLMDYATDTAYNFVDTTNKHIDEPWYTSSDRALYNAENGANDVLNYTEYKEAIEAGKTEKRWITEKDNRVRKSHKAVTQKPIPILEYFRVGMAQMRFPKDYELAAAFPEELVNCRCTIEYLPKDEEEKTDDVLYRQVETDELYRRTDNQGSFAGLEELMTLKNVKDIAGILGLKNVKVKYKIDRQKELIGTGFTGSTSTDGKVISIFPDAFTNIEQLVKTIGHEHTHLKQIRESGNINLTDDLIREREREAVLSEDYWWSEYVRKTGYRQ